MKLKLFIITIIVASFAMIGMLGGCGGNSGCNGDGGEIVTDEPRDSRITLWSDPDITKALTSYDRYDATVDGHSARVYKDGSTVVGLTVADDVGYSHTDKIYLLPSTQNIAMFLVYTSVYARINFTATSSNSSIASVDYDTSSSNTIMLVTPHAVGTTRINITAEGGGSKTWTDVIVVKSASDMPTFVE